MYDPLMTEALKLDRERDMERRFEIARQLRTVKAERKLQRQLRRRSWVFSLVRRVFPVAASAHGGSVPHRYRFHEPKGADPGEADRYAGPDAA